MGLLHKGFQPGTESATTSAGVEAWRRERPDAISFPTVSHKLQAERSWVAIERVALRFYYLPGEGERLASTSSKSIFGARSPESKFLFLRKRDVVVVMREWRLATMLRRQNFSPASWPNDAPQKRCKGTNECGSGSPFALS